MQTLCQNSQGQRGRGQRLQRLWGYRVSIVNDNADTREIILLWKK